MSIESVPVVRTRPRALTFCVSGPPQNTSHGIYVKTPYPHSLGLGNLSVPVWSPRLDTLVNRPVIEDFYAVTDVKREEPNTVGKVVEEAKEGELDTYEANETKEGERGTKSE